MFEPVEALYFWFILKEPQLIFVQLQVAHLSVLFSYFKCSILSEEKSLFAVLDSQKFDFWRSYETEEAELLIFSIIFLFKYVSYFHFNLSMFHLIDEFG